MLCISSVLSLLPALAAAASPTMDAPDYAGYRKIWWDNFNGAAGASPDRSRWNILDKSSNANGELEVYTSSNKNVQISGGNTLQIIPQRNGSSWTSARLESTYIFTPEAGKVTVVEAHLSFGTDTHKQGIWPAFWFLGDSVRKTGSAYVVWPGCGEVDAFEMVSGKMTGFGTIHCDVYPGGICNEAKEWDRRPSTWQAETISFFMDSKQYHQVTGARIGNINVWKSLAEMLLFFILNVAVGGGWPGYPDANTTGGYGNMMEVDCVAHYVF